MSNKVLAFCLKSPAKNDAAFSTCSVLKVLKVCTVVDLLLIFELLIEDLCLPACTKQKVSETNAVYMYSRSHLMRST